MKYELRPYQAECIEKIMWAKNSNLSGNDLCILPTGAGKSILIAELADVLNEPIIILQPTKEILEQNYEKLLEYVEKDEIGIYSASMNEKTINKYTLATIGSVYRKPEFFKHFNIVILDEAHLLNPSNLSGMFTKFLNGIGNPRVVGLTATPFRLATKYKAIEGGWYESITTIKLINRMKGFFWQRILFNIDIAELQKLGYLCPLEYIDATLIEHEDIPLNKSESDFNLDEYEYKIGAKLKKIIETITYAESISKNVLVFCSSVRQANQLTEILDNSAIVTSNTPKKEREQIISSFKSGEIKIMFNVGIFNFGFNHPALDCIVLLRPTKSIALHIQQIGRGLRIADGKEKCRVFDLTSNVKNLGKIETIKLVRREKWELESETCEYPYSWHNKDLYSFKFQRKPKEKKNKTSNFQKEINQLCPECGLGKLKSKNGKFGHFIGCSNFPNCTYTISKKKIDKNSTKIQKLF